MVVREFSKEEREILQLIMAADEKFFKLDQYGTMVKVQEFHDLCRRLTRLVMIRLLISKVIRGDSGGSLENSK